MSRYLVLYTFHRFDSPSMHHLLRLQRMNPKATVVPVLGVPQTISVPIPKLPKRYRHNFNWVSGKSQKLFKFTQELNTNVESFRRKSQFQAITRYLEKHGLSLYCDFTPIGKDNQDLAIINWFRSEGKACDFDVMVYFEYDMYATQTIEQLYLPYANFDAGFVGLRKAEPNWQWYDYPHGSKRSVTRWLKAHNAEPTIYGSFFPGLFLSRKVLENLAVSRLPAAFCEMRLPSVVKGLGFSVAKLDFPAIRAPKIGEKGISQDEIEANAGLGLFHPVYGDFDFSSF